MPLSSIAPSTSSKRPRKVATTLCLTPNSTVEWTGSTVQVPVGTAVSVWVVVIPFSSSSGILATASNYSENSLTAQVPQTTTSTAPAEATTFVRILRAHGTLRRGLEARLLADHSLTITDYEALLVLSDAEEGAMRRVDLADRLLLSPSGVTRLLDGLQRLGVVENGACANDKRVTYAVITPVGRGRAARLRDRGAPRRARRADRRASHRRRAHDADRAARPAARRGRRGRLPPRPRPRLTAGPVARLLVEQGTFNPKVAGSSPARPIRSFTPNPAHHRSFFCPAPRY